MKIAGDWLHEAHTQDVCSLLTGAGYRALFVGGCVRNALIGEPVADVDIATDARPEAVLALAADKGLRAVPTGVDHGTVTVIAAGVPHEITTFRKDVETDGRRAVVAFSTEIAEDAARRDFTMNALYAAPDGTLVDPLGGLADTLSRRVRFVGDPVARIREDYLRILRFFRFHACYGDPQAGLDAEGLAACAVHADGLQSLSRERVGAEVKKLLAARDPAPAVAAMAQAGILARILPGSSDRWLAVLVHLEDGAPPRWQRRLAILGGQGVAAALRLSREDAGTLKSLHAAMTDSLGPAALGNLLGVTSATDAVLLRAALSESALPAGWKADIARGAAATCPVSAEDLMPAVQGPALGARLKAIHRRWLDSDLALDRAALLQDSND